MESLRTLKGSLIEASKKSANEFFEKIMKQGEDEKIAKEMMTGTIACPGCGGHLYIRHIKDGTAGKCKCGIEWNDYDGIEAEESKKQ